jgi:superfamily I DNA and RNA helicase
MRLDALEQPAEAGVYCLEDEVVEVSLLLPRWQAAAMERLAWSRGMTLGQSIRRLINENVACQECCGKTSDQK